jgi:hypothetical protein
MNLPRVELAARNNAIWCDTVCRAHGVPGEFFPTVWLNRSAPPPYYSNLVVVSNSGARSTTLEHIRDLMELPLPAKWSVKDSFFNLDLATLGFEVLFQASWIWREPGACNLSNSSTSIRWSRVTSSTELVHWEAAWSGGSRNANANSKPSQFPSSLLADPQVVFFAGCRGHKIVAGGIANRTGDVVGLSNVFVNSREAIAAWTGLVSSAQECFPNLPLVGYERDIALEAALANSFTSVGSLRVWMRHD